MPSQQQISTTPVGFTLPADARWVPGYEGIYFCTPDGRLFSLYSRGRRKDAIGTKPLEIGMTLDKDGYRKVIAVLEGRRRHVRTHTLVAAAFHGVLPAGMVCAHLNGDKLDNRPSNLAYVTQAENIGHKAAHGTRLFGITHPGAKLTEQQAIEILADGRPWKQIAQAYGVSKSTVMCIKTRRTWKHLEPPK